MVKTRSLSAEAVGLVVGRGFIPPADVHRHGIRGRDVSQSNGVVLVEAGNGRSFAVKQLRSADDVDQGSSQVELDLYRVAGDDPRLRAFLPRLYDYDDERGLMILEGLNTSRRLDQLTGGWSVLSTEVAGWFGRALGAWHRASRGLTELREADPWLFHIDGDTRLPALDAVPELRRLTKRVLDDSQLTDLLERARADWRLETVIHGDVRFSNVMVQASPPRIRFIDWEMCGRGDPAWDVAGAIQEYLSIAARSDPFAEAGTPDRVGAFLAEYGSASGFAMAWRRLRTFVGCRLVLRALQLASWQQHSTDGVDLHLELARSVGHGSGPLLRDQLAAVA